MNKTASTKLRVSLKKMNCDEEGEKKGKCQFRVGIEALNSRVVLQSNEPYPEINGLRMLSGEPYRNNDLNVRMGSDIFQVVEGAGWSVMFNGDNALYITLAPTFASQVLLI